MPELRALIFDVDGTIAETERHGHRVAFNQAFQSAGLDWHWSEDLYSELLQVAGGKERIARYADRVGFVPPEPMAAWAASLHRLKTQHYLHLLHSAALPLRPGIRRLIETARQEGVRLAIATTSALENVVALLKTSLAPDSPTWFDLIAAGDIVPAKKPAPDIYTYVMAKMGWAATECLAIEDSRQGLLAATQAGLRTIITVNDYTAEQDFAEAVLVMTHLGEPTLPCQVLQGEPDAIAVFDLGLARQLVRV
jgi:HAD superfamily hydrolase (TIGR01509 family)